MCQFVSTSPRYAVITIAIRLRYDYDPNTTYHVRLLPFHAIRREQKMNISIFRCSRVVVVSQSNRNNCNHGFRLWLIFGRRRAVDGSRWSVRRSRCNDVCPALIDLLRVVVCLLPPVLPDSEKKIDWTVLSGLPLILVDYNYITLCNIT